MRFLRPFLRAISAPLRWRQRRLLLAVVMGLASFAFLGFGLAGLLLGSGSEEPPIIVDRFPPATPTATPAPTPTPSDAAIARLIIDKIDVDSPVMTLGLDENGVPQTPGNASDVAWYGFTSKPGWGSNAVFTGHFDWMVDGQPVLGIFYHLSDLALADVIEVQLEDGTSYRYSVIGNVAIPYGDPKLLEVMEPTPSDMITLMTCGAWLSTPPSGPGYYAPWQVVRAEPMSAASSDGARSGGPL